MDPITCLAIASAITGLIQANNSSDGGVGALLTATLDYQRIMAKQLDSIQRQLELLVAEVQQFDEKLKAAFREDRVLALRNSIGEVAIRYRDWRAEAAAGYVSYQELQASNVMRDSLKSMRLELDSTMAKLEKSSWFDSMTVLHMYVAANLSLAVRTALGEPLAAVAVNAQRFLTFLDRAEDPRESGSILAELAEKRRRFDALVSGGIIKELGVFEGGFPEGGSRVVALHPPVRLIEYLPAVPEKKEPTESGSKVVEPEIPESWGVGLQYSIDTGVQEVDFNGVKQYRVGHGIGWEREDLAPDDHQLTEMTFLVPFDFDENVALASQEALAEDRHHKLSLALTELNAVIAGMAVCMAALANATATRQSIFNSFGGGQLHPGVRP